MRHGSDSDGESLLPLGVRGGENWLLVWWLWVFCRRHQAKRHNAVVPFRRREEHSRLRRKPHQLVEEQSTT